MGAAGLLRLTAHDLSSWNYAAGASALGRPRVLAAVVFPAHFLAARCGVWLRTDLKLFALDLISEPRKRLDLLDLLG